MSIKYYHLAKDEKPPDEFCAVRDMGGEPGEYMFYVPEAENAKLRDELAKARDPQRIGGQADPSSFVYAIEQLREFRWQHATNDEDAIPYINNVVAAHERENAKLRELCSKLAQVVANDDVTFRKLREIAKRELGYDFIGAYDSSIGDMDQLPLFSDHMRELGVEVDG